MRHNFKTEFLICLDLREDVNYVLARSATRAGATKLAKLAKSIFPGDKVYVTMERVLQQKLESLLQGGSKSGIKSRAIAANPDNNAVANANKCKCGKKTGQCVGSLACPCSAIANCKKADKWEANPIEDDEDSVDDFDVEEDFEYEEDDTDDSETEEYATNPEEVEEEEFEEDYRDNPDDEDGDEDEDEDDDFDDEEDDEEDGDDDLEDDEDDDD